MENKEALVIGNQKDKNAQTKLDNAQTELDNLGVLTSNPMESGKPEAKKANQSLLSPNKLKSLIQLKRKFLPLKERVILR